MSQKNILISDNIIQEILIRNYKQYNLFIRHKGQEILNLLTLIQYDLIIMNNFMPDMTGFEVCLNIKYDIRYYQNNIIPIIITTNTDTDLIRFEFAKINIADIFQIPLDTDILISVINDYLK